MKKNAVMFFLKSLLKSILVIVSILAVGAISYKVSYEYLSKQLEAGKLKNDKVIILSRGVGHGVADVAARHHGICCG